MRPHRLVAVVAPLLLVAACGDDVSPVSSGAGRPTGADEVVVQIDLVGGFVMPEMLFARTPSVTVYGDGTVLVPGAVIEIYPGPAYVPLQKGRIPAEEVDRILELAAELELRSEPVDAGQPPVADAPATEVTIDDGAQVVVHHAEALGIDAGGGALTDEQLDARERLERFVDEVSEVATSAADSEYVPEDVLVRAETADPAAIAGDPEEPQPRVEPWPVDEVELAEVGDCTAVADDAATAVLEVMSDADQLTFFTADDRTWRVTIRPLLPHEDGCPDR